MANKIDQADAEHGLKDVAVAVGAALGKLAHKLGLGETPPSAEPPTKALTREAAAPKKKAAPPKKKVAVKKAAVKKSASRASAKKTKAPAKKT